MGVVIHAYVDSCPIRTVALQRHRLLHTAEWEGQTCTMHDDKTVSMKVDAITTIFRRDCFVQTCPVGVQSICDLVCLCS